jgi:hypothetical protein
MGTASRYEGWQLLDETDELLLGHQWENAYLLRKRDNRCLFEADFYGDPSCGYISRQHTWAVVAGEYVAVWRAAGEPILLPPSTLQWVHAVRLVDPGRARTVDRPVGGTPRYLALGPFNGYLLEGHRFPALPAATLYRPSQLVNALLTACFNPYTVG